MANRRRVLCRALSAAALGMAGFPLPCAARARKRIFMVLGRGEGANEQAFRAGLARRQIDVDYTVRNTNGNPALLPAIVQEIKEQRPDLVYTWGTPQTLAVVGRHDDPDPSRFVRNIPVVFTFVANPLESGIVPSLQNPGVNVTGVIHIAPVANQVNTIQAYRSIRILGVPYNPAERNSLVVVDELERLWASGDRVLKRYPAPLKAGKPDAADIPALLQRCKADKCEMLYIGPDTFIAGINRKMVAESALELDLPTFSVTEPIVRENGAMFALSSSNTGLGRLTAIKAAQILLEGLDPGTLPVERLRRFSVVIHMGTVKRLGFYPSLSLLNYAEVIGA